MRLPDSRLRGALSRDALLRLLPIKQGLTAPGRDTVENGALFLSFADEVSQTFVVEIIVRVGASLLRQSHYPSENAIAANDA